MEQASESDEVRKCMLLGPGGPDSGPVRGVVRGFVGGAFGGLGDGLLGPCLPDVLLVGVGLVVR